MIPEETSPEEQQPEQDTAPSPTAEEREAGTEPEAPAQPEEQAGPVPEGKEGRAKAAPRADREAARKTADRRTTKRTKRRVCTFCAEKIRYIDYKDHQRLREFISDRGKILKGRATGTCARHQRALARAIKRARHMALLPFVAE